MNRRGVMQWLGIGSTAAAVATFPVIQRMKAKTDAQVLYGDGKHDDTLALQAFLNGENVVTPEGLPIIEFHSGQFRVSDTLITRDETPYRKLQGSSFRWDGDGGQAMFLHTHPKWAQVSDGRLEKL